jgi:hypothetical protein
MSIRRLWKLAVISTLFAAATAAPAWCTVLVDFKVTVDRAAGVDKIAESIRGVSLGNCLIAVSLPWQFEEVLVRMECDTPKDANTAIVQDISRLAGVKSIAVFWVRP